MGALVVAPMLLTWATRRNKWSRHHAAEAAALFAGLIVTCWLVFLGGFTAGLENSR
jgi:hypothetical protein